MANFEAFGKTTADNEILDWDSPIDSSNVSMEYEVLPEGEYAFKVLKFERRNYAGGEKIPPCPMAYMEIELDGNNGKKGRAFQRLFMVKKMEYVIARFFISIGTMKKGEQVRPNWAAVAGATGRCSVVIREYDGKKHNEIKSFLEPKENKGYTTGAF